MSVPPHKLPPLSRGDLRSPTSRHDLAVLPQGGSPWLDALKAALTSRGIKVQRSPNETLPFDAFLAGASIVVQEPGTMGVDEAWLRMCERAPRAMPVSAVVVEDGPLASLEPWFAVGFDEVLTPQSDASMMATRLIGRARSRAVQHHLASLDPLTGLVTQAVFHSRLDPTVRLSSRASMPMAVAVIDMDGFRDLERQRGRQVIRHLLQDFSAHLAQILRQSDTVARLGDDRFGLILHHITAFEARKLLFKLWRGASPSTATLELLKVDFRLSFTAGVAVFPGDSSDGGELYTRAEVALDVARASGQRRVLLYSETCGESGDAQGATDLRYHRVSSLQREEPE
jgi:diguanylate cyclase (GGDEF)-like protein